ncbi:MAG TPA: SRPBCC family protein [Thermoleophilaceae bacterium]
MATVRKEAVIDASPDKVWDAVRDWGALHERLVPGFATDARVEGRTRMVTFFTGMVLEERIVTVDEAERRLVWSIVNGPYEHHNGVAQVLAEEDGRARFVWTADLLPDEAEERTGEMMERGTQVAKETLEAAA